MKNELDVIRDISLKLNQEGIAYMITGSMALNYYTEPRMTRDIDLVLALKPNDVERFVQLFTPDYYISLEVVKQSVKSTSSFNLIHEESVIKVDCIVLKPVAYRIHEFKRRNRVQIQDFETFMVSKEDLILSKLYWAKDSHSELQLRDVKNLLTTGYDQEYLLLWAKELGVTALLRECTDG